LKIIGILFALVLAVSLILVPAAVFAQDACTSGCDNDNVYEGLQNCEWDNVKWHDNENSWHLYLQHWGRTPIQAMSRLAGLCGPPVLCADPAIGTYCPDVTNPAKSRLYGDPNTCLGGCASCRVEEQGCSACCDDVVNCTASCCGESCQPGGNALPETCPTTPPSPEACPSGTEVALPPKLPKCAGCWGVSLAFANKSWSAATIGDHPRISDAHLNHKGQTWCTGGNCGGDWGLSGCPHTECCTLSWCLQDNCFAGVGCAPSPAVPSVLEIVPCPCE
jgi:hypothetical protein